MSDYVELHCHSNFSLLDGAAHPEELVERAAALGMDALALTDHDAVYGAVRFVQAAREAGLHPILGAELTLAGGHHLTLLAEDQTGWQNLCWLITAARRDAPKGQAALPPDALAGHTAGLLALSGCRQGPVAAPLLRRDRRAALRAASHYRDLFGPGRFWIELQHHLLPQDNALVAELSALARHLGLETVATNNVHYATPDRHRLQDVLVCIRHTLSLAEAGAWLRPNSEYYLKSGEAMRALFATHSEAVAATRRIAERCTFDLACGLQDLPVFPVPAPFDAAGYLRHLCEAALPRCYGTPSAAVRQQLTYELGVIQRAGLANYFLIVWDLVRFAREEGIRCQGRGSAANSLVAYLLGIAPLDPLEQNLVFERFLSDERRMAPDIDLDFQNDRREEAIQYLYRRYGHTHAAMACTFVTFRARSAVRDVGKALGFPLEVLDGAAKALETRNAADLPDLGADLPGTRSWEHLRELCGQIAGFPRHVGIHNGGMVLTGPPLTARVPVEPATMPQRTVVQWDKDGLEAVGLVKIDVLGLGMLALIAEALTIVAQTDGAPPALERLRFDDPAVYGQITAGDTVGMFQVESRAQVQVLPRLKPSTFADLIVSISLIRPGPLQGNMVHPYLRRRFGEEAVTYLHPHLEPALAETLGVILFQEQVLKVAHDLAGLTPGQGEMLRRALGSKQPAAAIQRLRDAFLHGAETQGVPPEVAAEVFARLQAFGGYSFPKSHAAAFAVLVYQSAWLKHYHPAAFFTALLNHQPMGFWSPAVVVNDARRHGIPVLNVDLHASAVICRVEGQGIRLGLTSVCGVGQEGAERIVAARKSGPFRHLTDFCRRTGLPRRVVEHLILAGALDGWDLPRRQLLWELGGLSYDAQALELDFSGDGVVLPALSAAEKLAAELEMTGVSTGEHVMTLYRAALDAQGILDSAGLSAVPHGRVVRIAGLAVMHQAPPTAEGHHFITLEDERGMMNVIVRPQVYERFRPVLRGEPLLLIAGQVQRKDGVVNLLAQRAWGLGHKTG